MKRAIVAAAMAFVAFGCSSPAKKSADTPAPKGTKASAERCTTGKETPANEDDVVGKVIGRICIEGATKENKKKIDDAFALHAGSTFTADALRTDLESAYATDLVDDLRVNAYVDAADTKKVFLVVQVHERPKIASFTIEGAKANSNAELVKAFPMKSGDTYLPAKLRAHIVQLRDGYRAAGYKNVQIEHQVEPTNDERVNVKLTIKEE